MSTLNAAICTTISYTLWIEWYYLKNNYLTLRSNVKVMTVRDIPPYGHAPTYQISLTYMYLERQKSYGPDKLRWEEAEAEEKIRLKQYVSLRSKGRLIKYLHVNRWKQLYIELNHCLLRNWISTKFYFKKNGIIFKLSQEQRSINTVSEDEWQARPMRSLP
jgi:hypothetical protein